MYHVIIYSTLLNVSNTFAKRHSMTLTPAFYNNKARRSFSSLTDAQDFAYSLLGQLTREFCMVLMGDCANGYIIYQKGL